MKSSTMRGFQNLIYESCGIQLGDNKDALISSRIGKRMRALGIATEEAYLAFVSNEGRATELVELLDAISTNVTSFFREPQHFDLLRELLLRWVRLGQQKFRVWSAASSTGEEPYSIAMTMADTLIGTPAEMRVLATDISTKVLRFAVSAKFPAKKIVEIPSRFTKYCSAPPARDGDDFEICPAVKGMVLFKRLNLAQPPYPMRGPFDVIFCRNVMIYFDNAVRGKLIGEFERLLRPGGYLMVGHAESLAGLSHGLRSVRPAVYVKD
ncbi:MAG: chemotaxis protein [Candidatus Hydrogenedentota bacterium]